MIPNTNVGGKIVTTNEVSDDQKATFFSPEFKQEAASLALDQGYTTPELERLWMWVKMPFGARFNN